MWNIVATVHATVKFENDDDQARNWWNVNR